MSQATVAGWDILVGVENLLNSALNGEREICFVGGNVDASSRGLLGILFRRIKRKVTEEITSNESSESPSSVALAMPHIQEEACPLCGADMR